jgi:hypothetical protein
LFARILAISIVLIALPTQRAAADPPTVPPPGTGSTNVQPPSGGYSPNYSGGDMTRPENYFETRFYDVASGTTTHTYFRDLELRTGGSIVLDPSWRVGWIAALPIAEQTTGGPKPSDSSQDFGIGDAFVQGSLVHTASERWAYAFGARLYAPTGGDLGSGRWEIMPSAGVRYSFLEINDDTFFVPKVRYAIGFDGDDSRRALDELQIAPTLKVGLPDHWFAVLYPSHDVRFNFGEAVPGQTGRLFLPFDAAVGKKVTERIVVMWEASVPMIKDYPVYNFKTDIRVKLEF